MDTPYIIFPLTHKSAQGAYTYWVIYDPLTGRVILVAGVKTGDLMPQRYTEHRVLTAIHSLKLRGYLVSLQETRFYELQWLRIVDEVPTKWLLSQLRFQHHPDNGLCAEYCDPDEDFVVKILKALGLWR